MDVFAPIFEEGRQRRDMEGSDTNLNRSAGQHDGEIGGFEDIYICFDFLKRRETGDVSISFEQRKDETRTRHLVRAFLEHNDVVDSS
jgi:hypothetical protein